MIIIILETGEGGGRCLGLVKRVNNNVIKPVIDNRKYERGTDVTATVYQLNFLVIRPLTVIGLRSL